MAEEDKFQQAVDKFERTVSKLASFMDKGGFAGQGSASQKMGNGGWNSFSNWMGGRPNGGVIRNDASGVAQLMGVMGKRQNGGGGTALGGGASFSGSSRQGGSMGGGAGPDGGGLGGGGGFLSGMLDDQGGAMGIAGKVMGQWLDFGKRQFKDQLTLDTVTSSAAHGDRGMQNRLIRQELGSGGEGAPGIAFNMQDATKSMQTRRNLGTLWGSGAMSTQRSRAGFADYQRIGLVNPSLGAAGAAQVQADLASPGSTFGFAGMGGRLKGGGQFASMADMSATMRRYSGNRNMTAKGAEQYWAQGGFGDLAATQYGWSEKTRSAMRAYDVGRAKFTKETGKSDADWEALTKDKGRKKELGKYVGQEGVQKLKDVEGQKLGRKGDLNEDYMDSVEKAAEAAEGFEKALTNILNLPGIKQLVAASGGMATLDSMGGGAVGAGMLSMGNPATNPVAAIGMGKSIFGGLFGGAGPGDAPVAAGKGGKGGGGGGGAACGGNDAGKVASMIKAGKSKMGVPYKLGAAPGQTDAFDCSSFVQWMYSTIGKKITRVTTTQWAQDGRRVKPGEGLQPGDLLFRRGGYGPPPGHVGMYIGDNKVIDTGGNPEGVKVRPYSKSRWDFGAKRILGCNLGDSAVGNGAGDGAKGEGDEEAGGQAVGMAGVRGNKYGSVEETESIAAALAGADVGVGDDSEKKEDNKKDNGENTDSGGGGGEDGSGLNIDWGSAPSASVASYWDTGSDSSFGDTGAPACGKGMKKNHFASRGEFKCGQKIAFKYGNKVLVGTKGDYGPGIMSRKFDISTWMMSEFKTHDFSDKNPKAAGQAIINVKYKVLGKDDGKKKKNAYEQGAWEIGSDGEEATLHKGEMVLPKEVAEQVREVMARQSVFKTRPASQAGAGGKLALHFGEGSIVFRVNGAVTGESAQAAARAFAEQLSRERLYQMVGNG